MGRASDAEALLNAGWSSQTWPQSGKGGTLSFVRKYRELGIPIQCGETELKKEGRITANEAGF